MDTIIRKALKDDLPEILSLIKELAAYEKAPEEVKLTIQQLEKDGFGDKACFEALLAEQKGECCGMALYYYTYSTWKGRCLYLEDIIIREKHRRKGIGEKLFNELLNIAAKEKVVQMKWQVLEWNQPAINFYKKYKADFDDEWTNVRLTKKQIDTFSDDSL